MVRPARPQHARPRGRRALQEAYSALQVDLAYLRSDRYADHLEIARLTALTDELGRLIERVSRQAAQAQDAALAGHRATLAHLDQARTEIASLSARVAAQDAMLARLLEIAEHLRAQSVLEQGARPSTASEPVAPALPVTEASVDLASLEPPREIEPALEPALAAELEPVFAAVGSLRAPEAPASPAPAQSRPVATIADSAIDDETVRRLRLIREGYGA